MPTLQRSLLAIFFAACVYIFYSLNSGITITNDGSHFALFDSLVTTGSPELREVRQLAFNDSALYKGRYYSDRNPGLALTTSLFYLGLRPIESQLQVLKLDPKMGRQFTRDQVPRIPIAMLVPAFSGGLLLLGMVTLARRLGAGFYAALASALAIMFGTIALRYSTLFYSHIYSAALLVWGLALLFAYRDTRHPAQLFAATFLLSASVLAEHLVILVFPLVFIYLAITSHRLILRPATLTGVIIAGLVPMAVLMGYNYTCFESPFSIAHFHHSTDTQNHNLGTLMRFDRLLEVLYNLMFGADKSVVGKQDLVGLINASPFLLYTLGVIPLAIWGSLRLGLEHGLLVTGSLLLALGAASNFAPYGGWDRDYRYLLVAVPLLAPFLAHSLDFLARRSRSWTIAITRMAGIAVFGILLSRSVVLQFDRIRHNMQIQYDSFLVNGEAALVNVTMALALVMVLAIIAWGIYRALRKVMTQLA